MFRNKFLNYYVVFSTWILLPGIFTPLDSIAPNTCNSGSSIICTCVEKHKIS